MVVLFHAQLGPIPGGFAGVDVFFVVSGFLITGLLLRELADTGTVSLASFYARRARRLLPAAAVVLVATLAVSAAVLPPLLLPGIAGDVAAAAAYVSNMSFAAQATDYFSAAQAPSPILHYWSLGVEEQFYIFWPALLLLVAGRRSGRMARILLTVIGVSIASFGLSLWLTSANAPWAFFSLPTRAWELGLGGVLAVAGSRLGRLPMPMADAAGWTGLALIAAAALLVDQTVPYPGMAALLPTVGAALVIMSGVRPGSRGPGTMLGTAVPRFLGRISYSLYLWHWPVIVIPAIALGADLPPVARVALVVVAVVLAAVTKRLVEDPFRRGRIVGTVPRRNLAFAGALTMTVVLLSLGVGGSFASGLRSRDSAGNPVASPASVDALLNALASESPGTGRVPARTSPAVSSAGSSPTASGTQPSASGRHQTPPASAGQASGAPAGNGPSGRPSPSATWVPPAASLPASPDGPVPPDLEPSLGDARGDYPLSYLDHCHTQLDGHPSTQTCLYGNLASPTTIALFGDSHALAWFPALDAFAQAQGWRLLSLTMSACSPATIPIWVPDWKRVSWECNNWREQAIQRLISERPAIIVVAGTRGFATTDSSGATVLAGDARTAMWQAGMQRTMARLVPAAGHVILLADGPLSRVDVPVCLSQHSSSVLACATPEAQAINASWLVVEQEAAHQGGTGFINPDRWICPSSPCPVVLGSYLIYRDPGHLTATFAEALAPRLGKAILADIAAGNLTPAP